MNPGFTKICILVSEEQVEAIEKYRIRAELLLYHRLFSKLHLHFLTNATMSPILKRMKLRLTEVK